MGNTITRQCYDTLQMVLWHRQYELILFASIITIQWHWKTVCTFLFLEQNQYLVQTVAKRARTSHMNFMLISVKVERLHNNQAQNSYCPWIPASINSIYKQLISLAHGDDFNHKIYDIVTL